MYVRDGNSLRLRCTFAVIAPGDQEAEAAGHDGGDDRKSRQWCSRTIWVASIEIPDEILCAPSRRYA